MHCFIPSTRRIHMFHILRSADSQLLHPTIASYLLFLQSHSSSPCSSYSPYQVSTSPTFLIRWPKIRQNWLCDKFGSPLIFLSEWRRDALGSGRIVTGLLRGENCNPGFEGGRLLGWLVADLSQCMLRGRSVTWRWVGKRGHCFMVYHFHSKYLARSISFILLGKNNRLYFLTQKIR
jgi:hypothetical protein